MTFLCTYVYKTIERDNYENGCIGDCRDLNYNYAIKGETVAEVKQAIADHVGCELGAITVNPCLDDPSRIDAQRMENDNGDEPTPSEMARFKSGEIDLWAADYTFYFVTTSPAVFGE